MMYCILICLCLNDTISAFLLGLCMSNALKEFVGAYNELSKIKNGLFIKFFRSQPLLAIRIKSGNYNVDEDTWKSMDVKTRAELRVVIFGSKLDSKLLPILFPNIDFNSLQAVNMNALANPNNLPVNKIYEFIDDLSELVDNYLLTTQEERNSMNCVLDFIKTCANFLIKLLSFGNSQNFFETTTSKLEQVKYLQERIHSSYNELTVDESLTELEAAGQELKIS